MSRDLYFRGLFSTQRYAESGTFALSYALGFNFDSISILVSFLKLFKCACCQPTRAAVWAFSRASVLLFTHEALARAAHALSFIRTLRYFRLHPETAVLFNVLSQAGKDMLYFFFMLGLFLFGFVLFAQEMFGTTQYIFSDTVLSMTTLLKMIFGVVDIYWDMIAVSQPGIERWTVIIFFVGYVTWMFFILVNVFLAILNDAYGGVKGELEEEKEAIKAAKEERRAQGFEEKSVVKEKVEQLRRAARGRLHRFQSRLSRMSRRRKKKPLTAMDAIAQATVEGVQLQELDEKALRRRRRLANDATAQPGE